VAQALAVFEHSNIRVTSDPSLGDFFHKNLNDPKSSSINWLPHVGIKDPCNDANTQSPAIGFIHEIGHYIAFLVHPDEYNARNKFDQEHGTHTEEDRNLVFERMVTAGLFHEWVRDSYTGIITPFTSNIPPTKLP
jgi:hypothetical protein